MYLSAALLLSSSALLGVHAIPSPGQLKGGITIVTDDDLTSRLKLAITHNAFK